MPLLPYGGGELGFVGSDAETNTMNVSAEDNGVCGSDSDTNSDDSPDYYQPISAVEGGDEDGGGFSDEDPNPNFQNGWVENGVSSLDISDGDGDDDDGEKEEEATESERAIERAFTEDERRRNAPLPAENAVRVMEAMRQISFGGSAPDWAGHVPEDQWIDQVRRLRTSSSAATADSGNSF